MADEQSLKTIAAEPETHARFVKFQQLRGSEVTGYYSQDDFLDDLLEFWEKNKVKKK